MKYLLLDMDGTICEYFDPVDGKISMYEFPKGFFINKKPIKSVIKALQKYYSDYITIIFSFSPNEEIDNEKLIWLKNNGMGNLQHIFLRYNNVDKAQALSIFMEKNNIPADAITVIDDDLRVLRTCEKLAVHCVHPSHLVVLSEENDNT